MIHLKSRRELERMKIAGALVAEAHRIVESMVQPGVRTIEIEQEVAQLFKSHNAIPLFLNYPGPVPFPAVTCISVNDEVVHGIPGERVLQEGDLISVDTGCKIKGWCGDSAWTYAVGEIDPLKQKLMQIGEATLNVAIENVCKQKTWFAVARKMEALVHSAGFSLVEDFVGHGIGREMHEEPQVPNFYDAENENQDFELRPGMVLAIEPMINAGAKEVGITEDQWTVCTVDGQPSVHFEHTVAITADGPLILTEREHAKV